jgi:SNF2 family DNA or RNA helicase
MSFLGLWYGAFPFAVSDLTTHAVSPSPTSLNASLQNSNADVVKSIKSEFSRMTTEYNKAKDKLYLEEQGKLTLLCSSGKSSEGHVCNGDTSFSGFCRRYYSEQSKSWQSKYRAVHHLMDVLKGKRMDKSAEDKVLGAFSGAFHSLCEKPDRPHNCSIGTVMTRLENVGHEAVDFVEGLKVELLGFQRQSLKWALERETMEGGIQRLLWAKLPYDPTRKDKELYYNPILNRFRREPPNLVRGGFIAEEMGLGKTVISLAMILKNPAPVTPVSGSPVLDLEKETVASAWDKGLHKSTPGTNKKRGSILSRGTLVIVSSCHGSTISVRRIHLTHLSHCSHLTHLSPNLILSVPYHWSDNGSKKPNRSLRILG